MSRSTSKSEELEEDIIDMARMDDYVAVLALVAGLTDLMAGTLLYAIGVKIGSWRLDHIGMGLILTSMSEGDLLATIGDVSGVVLIVSGVTGTPVVSYATAAGDKLKEFFTLEGGLLGIALKIIPAPQPGSLGDIATIIVTN